PPHRLGPPPDGPHAGHAAAPGVLLLPHRRARSPARHPARAEQEDVGRGVDELLLRPPPAGRGTRRGDHPARPPRARPRGQRRPLRPAGLPLPRGGRLRRRRERDLPRVRRDDYAGGRPQPRGGRRARLGGPAGRRARCGGGALGAEPVDGRAGRRARRRRPPHAGAAGVSAPAREALAPAPVDGALAAFFADGARHGSTPEHRELWSALADAAEGGKRLRPALFHSVYLALGGRESAVAAKVAAALELLHTALVVHDDVIDGDDVRRGTPNVVGVFARRARERGHDAERAIHYGQSAAILAGDLALAGAVRTLALSGAESATVARMLDLLDRAIHLSAAGELADVRLSLDGDGDV